MKIYNYDDDGIFIGESIADESPLEKGVYLIPSYATNKTPLKKKDGYTVIFDEINNRWKQIVDYRNKTIYDIETKEELLVNYLGELKENHTFKKPNTIFDDFIDNEWVTNQELYNEYLLNEFRKERDKLLITVIDFYQKPLVWETLSNDQQEDIRQYRIDLLNSTNNLTLPIKPIWIN